MQVELIGDEHRDRVWKDRNGDYWQWYQDDERRGWKYQSPHNRWRFGGMHIPNCGPFTFVSESQETNMQVDELIREWRNKAEVIRRFSPEYKRGEADVWDYCADQLVAVSGTNKAETWHVPADDGSGMVEIRPVTVTPPIGPPPNQGRAMRYECDNDNHDIGCQCPGVPSLSQRHSKLIAHLKAFGRTSVEHGDMTPAAERILHSILGFT